MAPSQAQRKTSTPRTESVRFCSGPSGYKGNNLADYWTLQRQQSVRLSVVVMSWRKTYTGYSIGCAVVWAVILSVVAVVYPNRLHTFHLIGAGWWFGWTSATIARSVYPPPKLKLPAT